MCCILKAMFTLKAGKVWKLDGEIYGEFFHNAVWENGRTCDNKLGGEMFSLEGKGSIL